MQCNVSRIFGKYFVVFVVEVFPDILEPDIFFCISAKRIIAGMAGCNVSRQETTGKSPTPTYF